MLSWLLLFSSPAILTLAWNFLFELFGNLRLLPRGGTLIIVVVRERYVKDNVLTTFLSAESQLRGQIVFIVVYVEHGFSGVDDLPEHHNSYLYGVSEFKSLTFCLALSKVIVFKDVFLLAIVIPTDTFCLPECSVTTRVSGLPSGLAAEVNGVYEEEPLHPLRVP